MTKGRLNTMNHKLDLTALRDAITSLDEGLEVVSDPDWFNEQSEKVKNTLISGVVKNFEFVYEISVKMVKRAMSLRIPMTTKKRNRSTATQLPLPMMPVVY